MVTSKTTPLSNTVTVTERSHFYQLIKDLERLVDKAKSAYSGAGSPGIKKTSAGDVSLFNYMERLITRLRANGQIRTSETYRATLNSLRKFRNGEDMTLHALSSDILEAYEAWHRARGNTPNTISFYNRILRAAYNRAVEEGLVENRYPFKRVYTGVGKTVKRALPLETISRLKHLQLPPGSSLEFARDMFIMSFYLRGISFVDLAYLRKSDLKDGYLSYRRRKTGQLLTIAWTDEMQTLLDKYSDNPTDFLMPVIKNPNAKPRNAYRNAGYSINRNLKALGQRLGIPIPLTMYVARHSWASAVKAKGVPLTVISEGMGHENEATTRIYLTNLETSVVDQANSLIIKSI